MNTSLNIAFTNTFNILDVHKRSGTPFYMAKNMEQAGIHLDYISSLKTRLTPGFKIKRFLKKITGQHESSRWNIVAAKNYAEQVQAKLSRLNVQAVMTHLLSPIAYLDCKQPIVLWTDALYANLLGFVPSFSNHSASTIYEANTITSEFFSRCKLAIFSSEWAARGAQEIYGVNKEKISVVPFGANIDVQPHLSDIRDMLKSRSRSVIKLLFIGKEWERKGGDTVISVAKALHQAGHAVEVSLVGSSPPATENIPDFVKCEGYISKKTPAGTAKLTQLLRESHFLFVPSRAEAFGLVFCEANAFGLPCLTTHVGGIPTIVKNDINGMTFSLDASPEEYCNYIVSVMQDHSRYEELALASFHEFETRLNWPVSVRKVKKMIEEII